MTSGSDMLAVDPPHLSHQPVPTSACPRLAVADDVAPVVAFLASDGARYVQGATIEVNGGLLARVPGLAGAPAAG